MYRKEAPIRLLRTTFPPSYETASRASVKGRMLFEEESPPVHEDRTTTGEGGIVRKSASSPLRERASNYLKETKIPRLRKGIGRGEKVKDVLLGEGDERKSETQ